MRAERRLAAIMAADVVGYSRLMGDDEEGTVRKVKSLIIDVVRPAFEDHRGRVVKTMGDGFLGEFASVIEAFHCALRLQDAARERNAGVAAAEQVILRIGINIGDIIIDDGDVFGEGVNIAARLEAMAQPGGICVSHRAWEDLHQLEARFDDLGEQKLKNISRPVRVHAYRAPSATAEAGVGATEAAQAVAAPEVMRSPAPVLLAQAPSGGPAATRTAAPRLARRPVVLAGVGVAGLVALAGAVLLSRTPKPRPADPYAFVQAQIAGAPCSWLRVSDHSSVDGLETYKLSGATQVERAALAEGLVRDAKAAKVAIDRVVVTDVAPLDPSRCAWVDTLKAFRYGGVPRFDLRLSRTGRNVTRAALTFDPQALGKSGALFGIEPSGHVERIVGREELASLRPPALVVGDDGRHTLNIDIDRPGWNGFIFMSTSEPPPAGLVEDTLKSEADRKRFAERAAAGDWRFEIAWFEVRPS